MWEAVGFTVLSAAGSNIGKVLQKQGTKGLPRLSFSFQVMRKYISSRTWTVGFLLDILGGLLMLRAVSQAPVSVVQPVSGCGLAILALFSHFYLQELMKPLDWLGIALAGAGTIGVGIFGEESKSSSINLEHLIWFILLSAAILENGPLKRVFIEAVLLSFKGCNLQRSLNSAQVFCSEVSAVSRDFNKFRSMHHTPYACCCCTADTSQFISGALDIWRRLSKRNRRAHQYGASPITASFTNSEVMDEIFAGLQAGTCFGMAAVVSRMGFVLSETGFSKFSIPLGILCSILCSGSGFFCQTKALKDGRAVVVSTCAAVSSILTGVLAGMIILGETLPASIVGRTLLLAGWLFIIVGVIMLMNSSRVGLKLPRSLRRFFIRLKANNPQWNATNNTRNNPSSSSSSSSSSSKWEPNNATTTTTATPAFSRAIRP